jgi:hypothetical protein
MTLKHRISETNPDAQAATTVEDVIWAYRENRNVLLDETDRYMNSDYPITDAQREEMRVYRQALRDATDSFTVTWDDNAQLVQTFPSKPTWT